MSEPKSPLYWRDRAQAAEVRLAEVEAENERLRNALRWIDEHARDEEALSERAVCDDPWHVAQHLGEGDRCPTCHSEWWATDGSLPGEEGSYAMQAVAHIALNSLKP